MAAPMTTLLRIAYFAILYALLALTSPARHTRPDVTIPSKISPRGPDGHR